MDREAWPQMQARFGALFKTRTLDEWCALLEGTDACFAPVLTTDEAPLHWHNRARGTYVEIGGVVQPAPAPRFSRSVAAVPIAPQPSGPEEAEAALGPWLDPAEVAALKTAGTLR
jgi:alpha-methylacyl-CoA racemase